MDRWINECIYYLHEFWHHICCIANFEPIPEMTSKFKSEETLWKRDSVSYGIWLSVFQHSLDAHPHPLGSTPNHLPWVFNDAAWCWVLLQTHRLEWLETPYDFMVSKKCKVYQSQQACMSYCTVCSLHMLAFLVHWICTGTEQIADRQRGRFNMFPLELMPQQFISLFMICHQSSPSFWNPAQVLFPLSPWMSWCNTHIPRILGPWRVATCSRWSSWWHCRSLDSIVP